MYLYTADMAIRGTCSYLLEKRTFSYLDIVDEDLPEASGKHVLGVLA